MIFSPDTFSGGQQVETNKALLLLDFQKDFVEPDGKLPVSNAAAILPRLPSLISAFRAKGDVIWVQTEYVTPRSILSPITHGVSIILKEYLELSRQDNPERQGDLDSPYDPSVQATGTINDTSVPDPNNTRDLEAFLTVRSHGQHTQCCQPATNGSRLPQILMDTVDAQKDIMLVKSHYSAFADTTLLQSLRAKCITRLYICGTLSNVSVFATVLDAVSNGLTVVLVEDCMGFRDAACHEEAMRQMADNMCADGIDQQELMDDLAGLLGDVIKEEDYTTRYHVRIAAPSPLPTTQPRSEQLVQDWMASIETSTPTSLPIQKLQQEHDQIGLPTKDSALENDGSIHNNNESSQRSLREETPELSPPRKRPTSVMDPDMEEPVYKHLHRSSQRRASSDVPSTSVGRGSNSRPKVRGAPRKPGKESPSSSDTPLLPSLLYSKSTGDIPDPESTMSDKNNPSSTRPPDHEHLQGLLPKESPTPTNTVCNLTPYIGAGDCHIIPDVLPSTNRDTVFDLLKAEVEWSTMSHRGGEVPRLVAVQGSPHPTAMSSTPIYRHPADKSLALLPFSPTVDLVRQECEKIVGHCLNHCLIQLYRSGEDNISEHSDKTLDIVPGSTIVNYSAGAERTMRLRIKKSAVLISPPLVHHVTDNTTTLEDSDACSQHPKPEVPLTSHPDRPSQSVPLPHNSLFLLGPNTNRDYLHSIRADKRPASQKTPAELAHGGQRISLTFRHIGTFVNSHEKTIFGQGATGKTESDAKPLLNGADADRDGEKMIRAFGHENHLSSREWDWQQYYGRGFDVVDFENHDCG